MLTFSDLVKRIAELSGCAYYTDSGQGVAEVPIDQHDLDKCRRVVNDAVRMFIADAPATGWRWTSRLMSITLDPTGLSAANIAADPARYYLATDFGGTVDGDISYAAETAICSLIQWADEAFIRERRVPSITTGYPLFAAIKPYEPTSSTLSATRRWELIVDPQPVAAHVLQFPYTMTFNDMKLETGEADSGSTTTLVDAARSEADDYFNGWTIRIIDGTGKGQTATITDYTGATGTFAFAAITTAPDATSKYALEPAGNLHPAGSHFDEAILCAAKAQSELQFDGVMNNYMEYYRKVVLPNSYKLDARSAPRKLSKRERPCHSWDIVTYTPRS